MAGVRRTFIVGRVGYHGYSFNRVFAGIHAHTPKPFPVDNAG